MERFIKQDVRAIARGKSIVSTTAALNTNQINMYYDIAITNLSTSRNAKLDPREDGVQL
jgi:hypothetical protein